MSAELLRQTGEAYLALANDPTLKMEASFDGKHWSDSNGHSYGRIKPAEKTPEQLRVEENKRFMDEVKDPRLAQWRCPRDGYPDWRDQVEWGGWDDASVEFRRKLAPKFEPFTFADDIVGKVAVRKGDKRQRRLIVAQDEQGASHGCSGYSGYTQLLENWTIDGQPAGKRVEEGQ